MESILGVIAMVLAVGGGASGSHVEITPPIPTTQGNLQSIVTVRDAGGAVVAGLPADSFAVTIDGAAAHVVSVRPITQQWLAVALLIDKSGSMRGEPLEAAKAAAKDFVMRCAGQTLFAVVPFDDDSLPPATFLRADQGAVDAIEAIRPGKNTALYDAILTIVPQLADHWAPRKAMIALTDGKDTRSRSTFETLLERIKGWAVPVYTVGLGSEIDANKLEAIAGATGGKYFNAPGPSDLIGIYQAIAADLESGYVVEFALPPGMEDGGRRQLGMTVGVPGGKATRTVLFEHGGHLVARPAALSRGAVEPSPSRDRPQWGPVAIGAGIGLVIGLVLAMVTGAKAAVGSRVLAATLAVVAGALAGGLVVLVGK